METPLFFIGKELSSKTQQWLYRQQIQFVEQIEQSTRTINAYLFFSPSGIDSFKASGNFTYPDSLVFANENATARAAWRHFTNKVHTSPDIEELSFVQYSIFRWMKENKVDFLSE